MKKLVSIVSFLMIAAGVSPAQDMKKQPLPEAYGSVVINNYSASAGRAPVVFDHWLHRARFTCRLCHVDLGFAMEARATKIKASDNMNGNYCGACHNGKAVMGGRKVFKACSAKYTEEENKTCERCHSWGKTVKKEYDFYAFTRNFPKEPSGNGINWEKAEADKAITLTDTLEGLIKRGPLAAPKDFSLKPKGTWMSDIKFSHTKHVVWSGCEGCHPDIFNVEKGTTQYSMLQVFNGQYCGVCHGKVAFPLVDCQRCHKKPV